MRPLVMTCNGRVLVYVTNPDIKCLSILYHQFDGKVQISVHTTIMSDTIKITTTIIKNNTYKVLQVSYKFIACDLHLGYQIVIHFVEHVLYR